MSMYVSLYISAMRQLFPGTPTYTEKDIPDLSGKVYLVTGANTGIGKEISRILFSKNATVWAAARSERKGRNAIQSIREEYPSSTGRLEFLLLDLGDLMAVKKAAETFLEKEKQLHVLFNNAAIMMPPKGSKSAQGYELQLGVNCLGPFLFTKLLTPMIIKTAKISPKNSVRVVWVSSSAGELLIPVRGGIDLNNLDYKKDYFYAHRYGLTKAGDYYYSVEYARRHREDGIVSISLNPGNLKTDLDRNCNPLENLYRKATTYPAVYGAYTELFAGISDEVTLEKSGDWIVPWGRFSDIRKDLFQGSKPQSEGGTGIGQKFWAWSEEQVKPYV
ncbi:short-chain dehydrogenase [Hypoxylon trugodes]|uniref:short-chain dehydrogenase n=1 Tax=Hypoxylon trugodes TaxID=326681 RepID=UPI002196B08E|nr:short-chain dehydrogenase [Hypoxylon trugodes]KAI1384747.1 short-chain dehydrogenase [Hypoxylon trugodes]